MRLAIRVTTGEEFDGGALYIYDLPVGKTLIVGRSSTADIVLADTAVSRQHAGISIASESGNGITIEDLQSTNGMEHEGRRITNAQIGVGDTVHIGRFGLTLAAIADDVAALEDEARRVAQSGQAEGDNPADDAAVLTASPSSFIHRQVALPTMVPDAEDQAAERATQPTLVTNYTGAASTLADVLRRYGAEGRRDRIKRTLFAQDDWALRFLDDWDGAEDVAKALREVRAFDELEEFTQGLILAGVRPIWAWRLHARALLGLNSPGQALIVLSALLRDVQTIKDEKLDVLGFLGKSNKTMFLHAHAAGNHVVAHCSLANAHAHYAEGMQLARGHRFFLWFASNVASLRYRGEKENQPLSQGSWREVVDEILRVIDHKLAAADSAPEELQLSPWDCATAGEMAIVLGDAERARTWFARYQDLREPSQLALQSVVDELQKVWAIPSDDPVRGPLIRELKSYLIRAEHGSARYSTTEIATATEDEAPSVLGLRPEAQIGRNESVSPRRLRRMLGRVRSIVRIGNALEPSRGNGTGILINGAEFAPQFGDRPLLLTCGHVITDHPDDVEGALAPSDAVACFFVDENGREVMRTVRVGQVLWHSPFKLLDATICTLEGGMPDGFGPCPIAPLPRRFEEMHVFNLGYPRGGDVMISQGHLLPKTDRDAEKLPAYICAFLEEGRRIKHNCDTEPGCSGGPILAGEDSLLLALHHAGVGSHLHLNDPIRTNLAVPVTAIVEAIGVEMASSTL